MACPQEADRLGKMPEQPLFVISRQKIETTSWSSSLASLTVHFQP
jgi:hypothetical protein